MPLEWPGFVVFGYREEDAKLVYDVLNLPYQYVITRSEWWRLGHEAGHACVDLESFAELPRYLAMCNHIAEHEKENPGLIEVNRIEDLLHELIADVFEFEFAFRRDYDLYTRTKWRFLNRRLQGQEEVNRMRELLVRTTFVFMYNLELKGSFEPGDRIDDVIELGKTQHTIPQDRSMDRARCLQTFHSSCSSTSVTVLNEQE